MLKLICLTVIVSFVISKNVSFDWPTANTSITLCAASYCSRKSLLQRNFTGHAEGFNLTKYLYQEKLDVNGYIGYRETDSTIYVIFRGTQSFVNFYDDFDFITTSYPGCLHCSVHLGFYSAEQAVLADVINEVTVLKSHFPSYRIVVTGHSLGAAIATLAAADLTTAGITVTLINFGSPRLGNKQLAAYLTDLIPPERRFRVTHLKDAVPHVPTEAQGFLHMAGEWYEDARGIRACQGFEDSHCNDQWLIGELADHLFYLGVLTYCTDSDSVVTNEPDGYADRDTESAMIVQHLLYPDTAVVPPENTPRSRQQVLRGGVSGSQHSALLLSQRPIRHEDD